MTSHRILHPLGKRRCAFGCPGCPDALRHYARCRPFHNAIRRALARPLPLPVLHRWGLLEPNLPAVHFLAVAHAAYNAAKGVESWPLSAESAFSCALAG
eukprot:4945306-Pyramimonas_sp.AAC.1